jgi:hypothetical protein
MLVGCLACALRLHERPQRRQLASDDCLSILVETTPTQHHETADAAPEERPSQHQPAEGLPPQRLVSLIHQK